MKRIGLAVHNIHEEYSIELIKGVEKFCTENNYQFIIVPISAKHAEKFGFEGRPQAIKEIITIYNFDAMIMSAGPLCTFITKEEFAQDLKKFNIPVVNIGLEIEGFPAVLSDSKNAFVNTISHLIKKHHRKNFLLFTANDNNEDSFLRKQWFLETLKSHNLKIDDSKIINGDFNRLNTVILLNEYIEKNGIDFDCIVCLNDGMALGVIETLKEHGINVPKNVIVTGFDNTNRSLYSTPTLTTIDPQISLQAYNAAFMADCILQKKTFKQIKKIQSIERFRVSCGCINDQNILSESIDAQGNRHNYTKEDIYNIIHTLPQSIDNELYSLHHLVQHTLAAVSLNDFLKVLQKQIERSSLDAMSLFIFDKPKKFDPKKDSYKIPHKVKRIYTYEKNVINSPDFSVSYFNPLRNVFPESTFQKHYSKIIIYPLYETVFQYGYIIVPLDNHDFLFYELILELFSKEITSAIKLNNEQEANLKLESKNSRLAQYNTKITTLSTTDELTGLNNRRGFINLTNKMIKRSVSKKCSGMILFCDMDGLKKINDTYGHEAGDRAILLQSQILRNVCRSSDIISRFGGDEFAIAVDGMDKNGFEAFIKRIEAETKISNECSGEKFKVSISIGSAAFNSAHTDLEKLLDAADKELYKVKAIKHNKK